MTHFWRSIYQNFLIKLFPSSLLHHFTFLAAKFLRTFVTSEKFTRSYLHLFTPSDNLILHYISPHTRRLAILNPQPLYLQLFSIASRPTMIDQCLTVYLCTVFVRMTPSMIYCSLLNHFVLNRSTIFKQMYLSGQITPHS